MATGLIIGALILLFAYGYLSDRERKSSKENFKIDPPATKEELKALKFYRQTKCHWIIEEDDMDDTTHAVSDKEYVKHLRSVSSEKQRENETKDIDMK